MATFSVTGVRLAGVSATVPRAVVETSEFADLRPEEREKFVKLTGVQRRRRASAEMCTSDMCFHAAESLLRELAWSPGDVSLLVFVSQSNDYVMPATSLLLQNRLGLPKSAIAFDVGLGCSGYVYGLAIATQMLAGLGGGKALLLAGETPSKMTNPRDRSTAPLFGDAGTATALEVDKAAPPIHFDLGSDGGGGEAIIVREGSYRHPVTAATLEPKTYDGGVVRCGNQLALDGPAIFNFSVQVTPGTVAAALRQAGCAPEAVDWFVFHQANRLMNEQIRKKLKIPEAKYPYSLGDFGNTSSAAIPLTMVTACRDDLRSQARRLVLCGFGVGLSWGTAVLETRALAVPLLGEI